MMFLRRSSSLKSVIVNSQFLFRVTSFCSKASMNFSDNKIERQTTSANYSVGVGVHLSPLVSNDSKPHSDGYDIELVDDDTWQVSVGLAHMWRGLDEDMGNKCLVTPVNARVGGESPSYEGDPDCDSDFDEIDSMRIRGDLFYKLDKNSKEFEEYSYDFHRRKKSSKAKDERKETANKEALKKRTDDVNESKKKEKTPEEFAFNGEKHHTFMINESYSNNIENSFAEKKARTPTFNQLTAPYHEPFCLDIFISKASVRACIIHRVTSKVVAVAHSISKDMKFDLGSTRNANACVVVGSILAQRALADDIHDVVYTPRKGDKLEGKLQIVLQAVIKNGVNVKVKLKQRKHKKGNQCY